MRIWSLTLLLFLQSLVLGRSSGPNFSFYHKTDEINNELQELNQTCNGMVSLVTLLEDPLIYAVDIENKEIDAASLTKSLFIFGEHSRELISAETGLHLLRQLCGKEPNQNVNISQILRKNKFRLIINSNPKSRKLVEEGSYCQRTNENNVDLNRNWDAHWTKEYTDPETNPGPKPFSEPETRALKEALVEFKPNMFLTVHSGALGMYTPYAYLPEDAHSNKQNMLDILDQLNPKYCNCKSGSAAAMLETTCPGTCLDYAYEHQAPYAFAFEIYKNHQELPGWSPEDSSVLTLNRKGKKLRGAGPKKSHLSCFFETSSQQQTDMSNEECFAFFNPRSEKEYNFIINNWTTAILGLVQLVNQKIENP